MKAFFILATTLLLISLSLGIHAEDAGEKKVSTKGTVNQYRTFVNETNFGVVLMLESGEDYGLIEMEKGMNSTETAIRMVGEDYSNRNFEHIALLLDESSGGRCDACRTTVDGIARVMMDLIKEQTVKAMLDYKTTGILPNGGVSEEDQKVN